MLKGGEGDGRCGKEFKIRFALPFDLSQVAHGPGVERKWQLESGKERLKMPITRPRRAERRRYKKI